MTKNGDEKRDAYTQDRFEAVRGKADIKWRTDDLMAVLRGDDKCCSVGSACPGNSLDPGAISPSD
ncbi:hypothetical protein PS662_01094 [Pseudomonas fluorescens]|uniref:Uncharacterized protein n=1 Tax=Pseudomonas fluorescens TaxID=294 RepID=A0A5E6QN93_PSEFL|nr:hypothetical protein PS662_01094 [Pseudomonas fluorescens]